MTIHTRCGFTSLRHKSEAFKVFQDWKKKLFENQTRRKIKVIRMEKGLEFLNENFNRMCSKYGIKRHLTMAYTPQQLVKLRRLIQPFSNG